MQDDALIVFLNDFILFSKDEISHYLSSITDLTSYEKKHVFANA